MYVCINVFQRPAKKYFKWRALGVATDSAAAAYWGNLLSQHNPL
jgi:hypothetical protein